MTDVDREQLKRRCTDALEALTKEQRLDGLAELADAIWALGAPYDFHGPLMLVAVHDRHEPTIAWHLIHVLEKLEKET